MALASLEYYQYNNKMKKASLSFSVTSATNSKNKHLPLKRKLKPLFPLVSQNKKKEPYIYRNLFQVIFVSITILIFSTSSFANKDQQTLHGIQLGTFSSLVEAKKVIAKLHQLDLETRIIPIKNGYKVAAGAFSSQTNLERALERLAIAGLADKTRVIEIGAKLSKATSPKKIQLARTTLGNSNSSLIMEEYVPKKEHEKLEREVELLKAQMQTLLKQKPSSETKIADATPKDSPTGNTPHVEKDSGGIAEGSREEEAEDLQRQLDTFLRRQKVLFKRGELEVEFGLSYAQNSSRSACFNPTAGSEFCRKDKNLALSNSLVTRSVDTNLSVSYGIADDLALSLSLPYSYSELESDSAPFTVNQERVVNHNNHIGIGDISGSLRYTAWHESGATPGITLNLNAKAPSGDDKRRLGSGLWSVGAGMSLVKTIDPVVFFGSLGYTARLPAGGVDLGDQISYSLGGGFSLNNRVSVAVALSGSTMLRDEVNGLEVAGSAQDITSLQFSSTIKLTKALFVEPFVAFGLTEGASDFVFGINVPYRFEDKYPLPFFSD